MKQKIVVLLLFMAMATFSQSLVLVSPNGGESYSAGQQVTITWSEITQNQNRSALLYYSFDNGTSWIRIENKFGPLPTGSSFPWTVPHLKQRTDFALIKITTSGIDGTLVNVSDGTFTIQASPPDAYEPNNDFTSAYSIPLGDSVVKNATVMTGNYDSANIDMQNSDMDLFKVSLSAGKLVTISTIPWVPVGESRVKGTGYWYGSALPAIHVYNASRQEVGWGYISLECNITQSGDYYCKISTDRGAWAQYGLSILQQGSVGITLVSPNGGESYSAEQKVTISWTKDGHIPYSQLYYSINNGMSWTRIWETDLTDSTSSFLWTVPHLKQRTDLALIKIIAADIQNPPSDVSNGTFTIQASPSDAYEPNNDFASAYPIAIGDSVVQNAIVFSDDSMFMDTLNMDTLNSDVDFFKVTLSAGKLVTISSIPWFPVSGDTNSYGSASPIIQAYDASKNLISQGGASLSCNIVQSGVYYCKIFPTFSGSLTKYGLSIKSATILSSQKSAMDTAAMQKTGTSTYTAQLIADTTRLNILLTLDKKVKGSVTTTVLAPDDLSLASNAKARVKTISVSSDSAFSSSIKTADITIPYSVKELNGNSEKLLTVFWLNDTTNKWTLVPSSIDTVKHEIVAHTTHFSIYGVFVKSNTAIGVSAAKLALVYGIKANYLSQKQSIAVHFSLPKLTNAVLQLYNIQGKCVRKSAIVSGGLSNSMLIWNLGTLANGKYFLSMKAGAYFAKESILIMN